MKTFPAGLVLLAILSFLPAAALPAQTSSGEPALPPTSPLLPQIDEGPDVTVTPDQGASIRAKTLDRASEQVGLRPNQPVGVTVHYPAAKAGQQIDVIPLDGGAILGPDKKLIVAADGTLRFRFKAGKEPGVYQVSLREGVNEIGIQFWVIDEKKPEKNPLLLLPGN